MKTDVLILSYTAYGRDFEAFILLKYHLEHSFHLTVHLESIRDLYWIDRLRPKILIVTDTVNPKNIIAAKYARQRDVLVVTIQGEGIFEAGLGEESIWGWNEAQEILEDLRLEWSERNRYYIVKYCPELAPKILVTGGGRFDRYRIYRFKDQTDLLMQYGRQGYKRVIGYAGWGFSTLSGPAQRYYQIFREHFTQEQLEQVLHDRMIIIRWLNQMVQAYPDILFILKHHPGDDGSLTEIVLEQPCENVLQIKNEEKIEDLVHACDLWIYYDSTTAIEAWLLNRPTCALVPSDTSFLRKGYEKGGRQIYTDQDLMHIIGSFVKTGELSGFDKLSAIRQQIIEKHIGWGDGFNSLRAAKAIVQLMEQAKSRLYRLPSTKERLYYVGRHIARLLLTRNGQIGYGGDGFKRGLIRMLLIRNGSRGYRGDGFVRGAIAGAEAIYYPQIEAFVTANQEKYEQVLREALI